MEKQDKDKVLIFDSFEKFLKYKDLLITTDEFSISEIKVVPNKALKK